MGSLAKAFIAQVAATSALTALIADRVYPEQAKIADKTFPLAVYKVENVSGTHTYDGTVNNLRSAHLVIACIAPDYADADAVATQFLASLDGTQGTWGSTSVQGCFLVDDGVQDDIVTEAETEEIAYYIKEITFLVWFDIS